MERRSTSQRSELDGKRDAEAKRGKLDRRDAVIALTSSPEGRSYLWGLMAEAKVFTQTYTGEALSGAFHEGQRAIGLRILADVMEFNPDAYIVMAKENSNAS